MEPEYSLPRDYIDIARLNLQHYLLTEMFGYLVHPAIDIQSNKALKIADVGCGTAIWSTSVAEMMPPTTEIVGLDITLSQTPPKDYLPPNVSLRVWNMFEPVPDDLVGYFDIVHIRLMVLVTVDPVRLLRNLLNLLKPGGWIQWAEMDTRSMRIEKPSGTSTDENLMMLWKKALAASPDTKTEWSGDMTAIFEAAGCLEINVQTIRPKRHLEFAMHGCNLVIYDLMTRMSSDRSTELRREMLELIERVALETRKGTMFSFRRVVAVGRKPLVSRE